MTALLAIIQLISQLVPQLMSLLSQAVEAHKTGDQARLDQIHDQAVAAANALKPSGL